MANEKRLIDVDDFAQRLEIFSRRAHLSMFPGLHEAVKHPRDFPTVDAVEAEDMKAFAKDVAYQFGYYCQNEGRLHITHGGLSTLEQAFDILGWENPHPVPECECEIDGCHEHATCGAPTNDGYKRMCGRHCRERIEEAEDSHCTYNKNGHCMGQKLMPECDPQSCDRKNQ